MSVFHLETSPPGVISKRREANLKGTADHHMATDSSDQKSGKVVFQRKIRLAGVAGRRQLPACMTLSGYAMRLGDPFAGDSDCAKAAEEKYDGRQRRRELPEEARA